MSAELLELTSPVRLIMFITTVALLYNFAEGVVGNSKAGFVGDSSDSFASALTADEGYFPDSEVVEDLSKN